MTKILATVGPVSSNKNNIKFILDKSEIVRFNMSHNLVNWHKKNINLIKTRDPNKYILVDIPGVKPRTNNKKDIYVKKNDIVEFRYNPKTINKNSVELTGLVFSRYVS